MVALSNKRPFELREKTKEQKFEKKKMNKVE